MFVRRAAAIGPPNAPTATIPAENASLHPPKNAAVKTICFMFQF